MRELPGGPDAQASEASAPFGKIFRKVNRATARLAFRELTRGIDLGVPSPGVERRLPRKNSVARVLH
jgi:hypothetical protein